ncbi:hypothetical protein LIER_42072 [Lithospermum erythrorhizon]|uniref:Uncharacterized protein n=1 Tax=Lithospermum erythrorhizon TaxID=34254 RepID=A0AAV3RM52_LITER
MFFRINLPYKLGKRGSFNLASMAAPRMSGENGANPASSVLVPHWVYPATMAVRASTCRWRAVIAFAGGGGALASGTIASCRFCCPFTGFSTIRAGGVWV